MSIIELNILLDNTNGLLGDIAIIHNYEKTESNTFKN